MKKYGILLSAEEHKQLKRLAADEGGTMQDIARDAVLAAIGQSSRPDLRATGPPADAVKFRRAAVAARQLAAQLEALAGDVPESEPTLTISYSALISMIQEIRKNGPDTSDSPTNEDLAQRVRARLGEDSAAPASDNSGTVRGPGRKRSAAG